MLRKLSIFVSLLALATAVMSVSAAGTVNPNQAVNGCFVNDTITTVNEGMPIDVTIECVGIPIDNDVFGFQFGTTPTGDFAGSAPSVYTDGEFTSLATGGFAGTLVGENALALYGVSRKTTNVVTVTDFTLGSYDLTAATNLTVDGSVIITFDDLAFKLSDKLGASLPNWLRTVNDNTTVVNDIDLAWLNGAATVKSDSNAIASIKTVALNIGAKQYTVTSAVSYTTDLTMDADHLYVEDAAGVVGGDYASAQDSDNGLNVAVTADMWGHLACSSPVVNLKDMGAVEDVDTVVGTSGVITLKAGDVNSDGMISNTDATSIGDDFGDTGGAINNLTENDINLNDTVDIFDLVHVGRNFNATTATSACS